MRRISIYILVFIMYSAARGQEGQFSQYFSTTSLLNPAFTGALPNITLNSNYKRAGNPDSEEFLELIQATFTLPFRKFTSKFNQVGGAGVTFFREARGFQSLYTSTKVLLNGAYTLRLSRLSNQYLVFGLQGGVVQQALNGNQLRWGSQFTRYFSGGQFPGYDPSLPTEGFANLSSFYPIFNFGVIYTAFDNANLYIRDKTLTLGLSIDNLNSPTVSFFPGEENRKFWLVKAFGSAKLEMSPRWYIHPSAFIAYSQGSLQANLGTYFSTFVSSVRSRTAVMIQMGTWYRVNDAFIGLVGFQVENIRMAFSVDTNDPTFDLEPLEGSSLPTFEVSLTYILNQKNPLGNVSSPIF